MKRSMRLPSYPNYRWLPDDHKQAMYEAWCQQQGLDHEAEGSGEAFISSMPDVTPDGETQDLWEPE